MRRTLVLLALVAGCHDFSLFASLDGGDGSDGSVNSDGGGDLASPGDGALPGDLAVPDGAAGLQWAALQSPSVNALRGVSGTGAFMIVVGDAGTVLRSLDGVTFNPVSASTNVNLASVWALGSSAWAVGGPTAIHTSDQGATWSAGNFGALPPTALWSVWSSSQTDVWAGGDQGMWHTTDAGTTWTKPYGNSHSYVGMWGTSATDIWAAVDLNSAGYTAHWAGTTWTESLQPFSYRRVWGTSATNVWACGAYGGWHHTTDGSTWSSGLVSPQASLQVTLSGVWVSPSGADVWVVGDQGLIFHTADQGITWTVESTGTTQPLYAIWGTSASNLYAVGAGGTILRRR